MGRTGCLIQNLTLIGSFFIYRYLICVFLPSCIDRLEIYRYNNDIRVKGILSLWHHHNKIFLLLKNVEAVAWGKESIPFVGLIYKYQY